MLSVAAPVMEFGDPLEQALGQMGAFPLTRRVLVRLGERWIDMYGAENLV